MAVDFSLDSFTFTVTVLTADDNIVLCGAACSYNGSNLFVMLVRLYNMFLIT